MLSYRRCIPFVILVVLTALNACGGSTGQPPAGIASTGLPALADLPRGGSELAGTVLAGADYSANLPVRNVAADAGRAVFSPVGSTDFTEMAIAGWHFTDIDATGAQNLEFSWETAPAAANLWVALANWDDYAWEWFNPADPALLALDDIAPYIEPGAGNLYVILVVDGTAQAILTELGFPAIEPVETGPWVEYINRVAGAPGQEVTFTVHYYSLNPATASWDFGGGAEPATATGSQTTVTLGAEGTYNASVTVTNDDGTDCHEFTLFVTDQLYFACGRLGQEPWYDGYTDVRITGTAELVATSESDGWFVFPNLPNGSYTATVLEEGFYPAQTDFVIDSSFVTDLHFWQCNGATTFGIVGSIHTENGGTFRGDVELTGDAERYSTNGVAFTNLPNGNYTVTPCDEMFLYYPSHRDITIDNQNCYTAYFLATTSPTTTFTISGTITLAGSGQPAEGITLKANGLGIEYAVTDALGYYEFPDLTSADLLTGKWSVRLVIADEAAEFSTIGYDIHDESDASGKDFVMTPLN